MLFNSGQFFLFFLCVYVLYVLLSSRYRWQNAMLLAASYVFYGAWDYRFLALLLLSTAVDYVAALRIQGARLANAQRVARGWLWASVSANLGMLGFFKYFNFFADSLAAFASAFGVTLSPPTLQLVLPIGISFYTFQTMGYTIDVYRGVQTPTKNPLDFALFVAFFPQLVAGPIERAKDLLPQLQAPRRITPKLLHDGGWLILWGFFKKVFIADNLAPYVAWAFQRQGAATALDVYLGTLAFAAQVYGDFSGYSDMARGLGKVLGVELRRNFNLPYLARNPAEVWRRWHITLAAWFRDYVYGPLRNSWGLGRGLAAVLAMLLVGLWHGAKWTFVLWGGLWGLALAIHRFARPALSTLTEHHVRVRPVMHWGGVVLTFHLWLIFSLGGFKFLAQ